MAVRSSSSSKGLVRKAEAPAFRAVERTSGSSFPVKMMTRVEGEILTKPRLNFQTAHNGHTNIDQRNRWAMSLRIAQELPGIVKCFCVQISRREKTAQSLQHRGVIVEQANNKGSGDSQGLRLQQPMWLRL